MKQLFERIIHDFSHELERNLVCFFFFIFDGLLLKIDKFMLNSCSYEKSWCIFPNNYFNETLSWCHDSVHFSSQPHKWFWSRGENVTRFLYKKNESLRRQISVQKLKLLVSSLTLIWFRQINANAAYAFISSVVTSHFFIEFFAKTYRLFLQNWQFAKENDVKYAEI